MAFFPNRDCATLKRPIEDESQLQRIDRAPWDQLRPEFVEQVKVSAICISSTANVTVEGGDDVLRWAVSEDQNLLVGAGQVAQRAEPRRLHAVLPG